MNGGLLLTFFLLYTQALVAFAAEFNYDGSNGKPGKDRWASSFSTCADQSQSPIDIKTQNLPQKSFKPFIFHGYDTPIKTAKVENNGHSVKVSIESLNRAQTLGVSHGGLDGMYNFLQYHMHWGSNSQQGSEHVVNTKAYPMELHLVHYKAKHGSAGDAIKSGDKDALAVLGIFFEIQAEDNAKIETLINAVEKVEESGDETKMEQHFAFADFLPRNTDQFYRYQGGLTTPGCNEIVRWTVFKEPIGISEKQMKVIRNIYEGKKAQNKKMVDNYRDPQPLNGRQVFDVDTSIKKFSSSASIISLSFSSSLIIVFLSLIFH